MTIAPYRVVHLEDSPLDCELVAIERESLDVELVCVAKRDEYLSALDTKPDLILSDFALPNYDGLSALAAARSMTPFTPFIFVSGAIGEERAIEALRLGATDYVLKTRLDRLVPAVRRAIQEAEDKKARRIAEQERDRLLDLERKARADAETANRMKDEFLAIVSHELRTPLNAILGWARILRTEPADQRALEKGLSTIERNALAQARLIDDVLDATRMITGKLRLEPRNVRVSSFVEAAVEAVRPVAAAKGVAIECHVAEDVGIIVGDSERLQQVVWNLLSNASKFSERGATVSVEARRVDGSVVIAVVDRGAGIDAEALPRIFDRFFQVDGAPLTRKQRGLGLGLAIVKSLVELHEGKIEVHSAGIGMGATFTVRLPISAVLPTFAPERNEAASDTPPPTNLEGVSILIVDDEQDHRDLLKAVLEAHGGAVTTAESAFAALDVLVHDRPDVVVSDLGMPHMDGYSLVRRIRALDAQPSGIIALTAFARADDRRMAIDAGCDLYFTKPVDPSELIGAIARLVRRARRSRGAA